VFLALNIQHEIRMSRVILSSVACLTVPYFFPYYLINGTIFKEKLLGKKCVFFIFCTFF